jgi:aspartyl-tRNA(Asn)/glutamyl-tRNA(Gln) amidotransferase subunit C
MRTNKSPTPGEHEPHLYLLFSTIPLFDFHESTCDFSIHSDIFDTQTFHSEDTEMSDLHKETLSLLSQLCRIDITEEECSSLYEDLKRVLDYVEQLQEVEVDGISPYRYIEEQRIAALRSDTQGPHLSRDLFLANAPDQVGGMIRVPTVIKQTP